MNERKDRVLPEYWESNETTSITEEEIELEEPKMKIEEARYGLNKPTQETKKILIRHD